MRPINELIDQYYKSDLDELTSWCGEIYETMFGRVFKRVREIYNLMETETEKLPEADLEWIITSLPLELFTVAERLNGLRSQLELIKLKKKDIKLQIRRDVTQDINNRLGLAKDPAKDEKIMEEISEQMVEHDLVQIAYSTVITRVENEISFSKELIMGAKKVWDSRRSAEEVPTGRETNDLPDYEVKRNAYIK